MLVTPHCFTKFNPQNNLITISKAYRKSRVLGSLCGQILSIHADVILRFSLIHVQRWLLERTGSKLNAALS